MPSPIIFGVLAFVLNYVPYLGAPLRASLSRWASLWFRSTVPTDRPRADAVPTIASSAPARRFLPGARRRLASVSPWWGPLS